jgi:hypothetical protein
MASITTKCIKVTLDAEEYPVTYTAACFENPDDLRKLTLEERIAKLRNEMEDEAARCRKSEEIIATAKRSLLRQRRELAIMRGDTAFMTQDLAITMKENEATRKNIKIAREKVAELRIDLKHLRDDFEQFISQN